MAQYCTYQAYHWTIYEVDKFRILYSKRSLAIEILTVYVIGNLGYEQSVFYSLCRVQSQLCEEDVWMASSLRYKPHIRMWGT